MRRQPGLEVRRERGVGEIGPVGRLDLAQKRNPALELARGGGPRQQIQSPPSDLRAQQSGDALAAALGRPLMQDEGAQTGDVPDDRHLGAWVEGGLVRGRHATCMQG